VISGVPHVGDFPQKIKSGSCLKAFVARTASPSCAAKKASIKNLYYRWSKEFLEAGKKRLAGDTIREASSDEVKGLRREAVDLKEVVAELTLENRLLKKSMIGDGGDDT